MASARRQQRSMSPITVRSVAVGLAVIAAFVGGYMIASVQDGHDSTGSDANRLNTTAKTLETASALVRQPDEEQIVVPLAVQSESRPSTETGLADSDSTLSADMLRALDDLARALERSGAAEGGASREEPGSRPPNSSSSPDLQRTSARAIDREPSADQYMRTVSDAEVLRIAQREYPNDSSMQKFIYDTQLAAKRYMQTTADREVQQIALREYPGDFSMQKFTYDQQFAAKQYMYTVTDRQVQQIALREYPGDFSMQKFTYDQQSAAKQYMYTVTDREVQQTAAREYPADFSMQRFSYDQQSAAKQYMQAQGHSAAKLKAQSEYPTDYSMQKFIYGQLRGN